MNEAKNNESTVPLINKKQSNPNISQLEEKIFQSIELSNHYQTNYIPITQGEYIKTIHIVSSTSRPSSQTLFIGHGFGGTSLMYFPMLKELSKIGDIVLWEIRGMGFSEKINYESLLKASIEEFYIEGIKKIVEFYTSSDESKNKLLTLISHSFGAYLTMLFVIKYEKIFNIAKCILLSPIGVTNKIQDYKNKINSYLDIAHRCISWAGWTFQLSYKSLLKILWNGPKRKLIKKSFSKFLLTDQELDLMTELFEKLSALSSGSEKYFYELLEPRVLPQHTRSLDEILTGNPIKCKIVFYYGGNLDWVDKQGAISLSEKHEHYNIKIFENCGHMLPLHYKEIIGYLIKEIAV